MKNSTMESIICLGMILAAILYAVWDIKRVKPLPPEIEDPTYYMWF